MNVMKVGMFMTLGIAVLSIYLGDIIRVKFPILKKYCLPSPVVGGTLFALILMGLYYAKICELNFDFATVNRLFYCIFFASSGAAASMALLKKGGKLVLIFAILAAILAFLQNVISVGIGVAMGTNPIIALMTGSIPMTGGHGNAASFAPVAMETVQRMVNENPHLTNGPEIIKSVSASMEVAIASATFGLISGSIIGGPFGNFIIKRNKLENPELDGKDSEALNPEATIGVAMFKPDVINAVLYMCVACGIGEAVFVLLKYFNTNLPIHVCCMLGGILVRLYLDAKKTTKESMYEAIDVVGDFSLALFVSMSIITMKLWQLAGLGIPMMVMLMAQVVFIVIFCYFLTFKLCGKDYDAAVIAVGHTGFGLGAVPVSMVTMKTVTQKYRYSRIAFFVVPVVGGFISNITNAFIITKFIDYCAKLVVK